MDNHFQQVWGRVTASGTDAPAEDLDRFADEEQQAAEEYAQLARNTRSAEAKRLFQRLSGEEREHSRRLRAMAYLLQGNRKPPKAEKKPVSGERTLQALRRRYAAEQESAEAYSRAAEKTKDERLRGLYQALAQDERRHGKALLALLQKHW